MGQTFNSLLFANTFAWYNGGLTCLKAKIANYKRSNKKNICIIYNRVRCGSGCLFVCAHSLLFFLEQTACVYNILDSSLSASLFCATDFKLRDQNFLSPDRGCAICSVTRKLFEMRTSACY